MVARSRCGTMQLVPGPRGHRWQAKGESHLDLCIEGPRLTGPSWQKRNNAPETTSMATTNETLSKAR